MNKLKSIVLLLLCLGLLTACGSGTTDGAVMSDDGAQSSQAAETADGYAELGGYWEVGAIYYRNKMIDVHDVAAMEDLYDCISLQVDEDGKFNYLDNIFGKSGTYTRLDNGTFLLKTDRKYHFEIQNEEIVEIEDETGDKTSYIVSLITNDENTLVFNEYDQITGNAKANDNTLILVKSGQTSTYIAQNKADISGSGSSGNEIAAESPASLGSSSSTAVHTATSGEKNALARAKDYLVYTAFSYSGLIDQLKFEGFTTSEAEYGADYCGADWEQQALAKARDYISYTAFSYSGLVEQLEFEGFTNAQASYGADNCGADWNEQAVKKAREYLDYASFSRGELLDQLEFEGFTSSQAEYGVSKAY